MKMAECCGNVNEHTGRLNGEMRKLFESITLINLLTYFRKQEMC